MKSRISAGKTKRSGAGRPAQRAFAGKKAAALEPPSYGIDFVDRGLPAQLRTGIESLSGMDLSDVRVHANSDKPAQLNALAYAQGNDIHLGPGQECSLPHEAWHVVQQREGRVRPTLQLGGTAVNDDAGLEREAHVMGARALQPTATESAGSAAPRAGVPAAVIQRDVGFEFETDWIVKKKKPNPGGKHLWGLFGLWPSWIELNYREIFYQDPAGRFDAMADDHSNIEFRTDHFPETVAGIALLTNAMIALTALAAQLHAQRNNAHFGWAAPLPMPGLQQAVRVTPTPPGAALKAAPQATVGVRLDQIHNMLREVSSNANAPDLMGTGDDQLMRTAVTRATNAANVNGAPPSRELKSLLTLLISYIYKGHARYTPAQAHLTYSKLIAPVMARTDFVEMFNGLPEAAYFGGPGGPAAFSAYVIATINLPGIVAGAPLFRYGFGDGNGGVTMLPLTRDNWLQGIAGGVDNMSSLVDNQLSSSLGSKGHGAGSTDSDAGGNLGVAGMVLELRRIRDLPFAQWQPLAIRMANFIAALNNNTVNPDNPVAY